MKLKNICYEIDRLRKQKKVKQYKSNTDLDYLLTMY